MLDIQFIRDNADLVQEKSKQKGYNVDVAKLLELDTERRGIIQEVTELQTQRNAIAQAAKGKRPSEEQVEEGRRLKEKTTTLDDRLRTVEELYAELLRAVPNMPTSDVPIGATEDENQVAKVVGEPKNYDFTPKHEYQLAEPKGFIDKERAAKISGSRFAYLKGDLVRLQFAIIQFVLQTLGDEKVIERLIKENNLNLSAKPFTPVLPPAVLRTEPYVASARLNAEEVTYKIEQARSVAERKR